MDRNLFLSIFKFDVTKPLRNEFVRKLFVSNDNQGVQDLMLHLQPSDVRNEMLNNICQLYQGNHISEDQFHKVLFNYYGAS